MIEYRTDFKNYVLEDLNESDDVTNQDYQEIDDLPSIQTAMYFDKGVIPHPTQGKVAVKMKGFLLFSLAHGEYPKVPSYDSVKMDGLLKKMALRHFSLDHHANIELKQLSAYPSTEFFLMAPSLKPWNKKAELFLQGTFLYWSMEEFLTRAVFSSMPLLTKEHFQDFTRFMTNIMTGLYRSTEAIPNLDVPFMNSLLVGWFELYQEMQEHVAGYEKFHVHLLQEIINWIRYYEMCALFMGCDWEPYKQPYITLRSLSDFQYKTIVPPTNFEFLVWERLSWFDKRSGVIKYLLHIITCSLPFESPLGRKVLLEMIQLLTATYLDDYTRAHVLFKIFCDSADLIFNLIYDIFNITREDWRGKMYCRNTIYRNVKRGMSFDDSLEEQLLVINNEVIDLRRAAKGLQQIFSNNEMLQKYIRNTMLFIDGSIRYFVSQTRYGKCEYRIMKVVRVPSSVQRKTL